jgi:serine/threonine-protein kinase PpkA
MDAKKGQPLVAGFTIVQRIGEGGQAQVYLAERDYDGLRVALKVLDARVRHDKVFLERFVREYKMLAMLEMEHVAHIYDQGFAGEHPYIAMEFLPSGTLAARIYEGMPARTALRITAQISRALDAIHSRGVIHRDLKPANILFRSDGRPVIVDFGLAKDLAVDSSLTGQQRLLATPRYMSPEQCLGRPLDARSDLYSLGAILWEMLTRMRIYDTAGPADLMRMHVQAPVPRLPAELAAHQPLLEKMLAKEPKDRFQSASDLVASITLP